MSWCFRQTKQVSIIWVGALFALSTTTKDDKLIFHPATQHISFRRCASSPHSVNLGIISGAKAKWTDYDKNGRRQMSFSMKIMDSSNCSKSNSVAWVWVCVCFCFLASFTGTKNLHESLNIWFSVTVISPFFDLKRMLQCASYRSQRNCSCTCSHHPAPTALLSLTLPHKCKRMNVILPIKYCCVFFKAKK